jgi:hypothetical protein
MGKPWENHGKYGYIYIHIFIWKNSRKVVVYPRKTGISWDFPDAFEASVLKGLYHP